MRNEKVQLQTIPTRREMGKKCTKSRIDIQRALYNAEEKKGACVGNGKKDISPKNTACRVCVRKTKAQNKKLYLFI